MENNTSYQEFLHYKICTSKQKKLFMLFIPMYFILACHADRLENLDAAFSRKYLSLFLHGVIIFSDQFGCSIVLSGVGFFCYHQQ